MARFHNCEGYTKLPVPGPCEEWATQEVEGHWFCGRHAVRERQALAQQRHFDEVMARRLRDQERVLRDAKRLSLALLTEVMPLKIPESEDYDEEWFAVTRDFLEGLLDEWPYNQGASKEDG